LPKCHVTFFPKILSPILPFWPVLNGFKNIHFLKIFLSHHTVVGGTNQCHKMTQGEGGVKNHSKKCYVLFECPVKANNTNSFRQFLASSFILKEMKSLESIREFS
jgi:hypothetical protein